MGGSLAVPHRAGLSWRPAFAGVHPSRALLSDHPQTRRV